MNLIRIKPCFLYVFVFFNFIFPGIHFLLCFAEVLVHNELEIKVFLPHKYKSTTLVDVSTLKYSNLVVGSQHAPPMPLPSPLMTTSFFQFSGQNDWKSIGASFSYIPYMRFPCQSHQPYLQNADRIPPLLLLSGPVRAQEKTFQLN